MINEPRQRYRKAAAAALLLHLALLSAFVLLNSVSKTPVTAAEPIEIEFAAASMADSESQALLDAAMNSQAGGQAKPLASSNEEDRKTAQDSNGKETARKADGEAPDTANLPASADRNVGNNAVSQPSKAVQQTNHESLGTITAGARDFSSGNSKNISNNAGGQPPKAVQRTSACCNVRCRPAYPSAALADGREGTVTVRAAIGRDGSVTSVTVRESSGYRDFDEAAKAAMRNWHFTPASQDGRPVEGYYDARMKFRLDAVEVD